MFKLAVICYFTLHVLTSQAATISIGGGCSIKDAIKSANQDAPVGNCAAGSGTDTLVTPDVWFLNLTATLPTITTDMILTTQTEAGKVVISGQDQYRIFEVNGSGTEFTLTRVELINGFRPNLSIRGGAAILVDDATVNINDSRIADNITTDTRGGAIRIDNGELIIHNTVLEYNKGVQYGGAIFARNSEVEITDSTFQYNQLGGGEGSSMFLDGGNLLLESSLISDNSGIAGESVSANINNTTFSIIASGFIGDDPINFSVSSVVTLNHVTAVGRMLILDSVIYASNSWITDCLTVGSTWVVDSHNASRSDTCNGSLAQIDTLLPLNNNGGPSRTRALSITSPLINAGDNNYCTAEDQRGEARNGLCDIGAYEANGYADVSVSAEYSYTEPFASNQTYNYLAKIKNNGPGVATAVAVNLVTDNVFIDSVNSPVCSGFPCVINNIQFQQEIVIPVTMTVGSHGLNEFEINLRANSTINSNHIDIDENDTPSNNDENDTNTVVAGADMSIEMELLTNPPYFIGQNVQYQATLDNNGQQVATGITFNFVPSGLNVTGFTGCSSVNGLSCGTLNLLNGDSREVIVDVLVTENQFDATGFVSSELLDINLENNTDDQANRGGVNETDISVAMTMVQNTPIYSDQFLQFEIRLKGGLEDASNVKIWSEFPGALINSHSGCSFLPCTIPLLEAEEEIILFFDYFAPIFDITAGNTFSHRIFVLPGQLDPDLSDNEVIIEDSLNPVANVAVFAELITQPPYYQNQQVEYQLRVINGGINTATEVIITAGGPNLDLLWAAGNQCADISCQISQLLRTQEENITAVYRIKEPGLFSLAATVMGDEIDLVPSNNISVIDASASEIPNDLIFENGFE